MELAVVEVEVEVGPKPKSHGFWTKELDAAHKRLRKFQKQGIKVVERYLDKGGELGEQQQTPGHSRLNLFHKNVKTQMDMMYGQSPKIDVTREHYDPDDDAARVASLILQRMLQADVTPSGADCSDLLMSALQDRLLPGLGQGRVRYEYDAVEVEVFDPQKGEMLAVEQVTDERAPTDYVHWQDFVWGWARTWNEVPWVAFRSYMDKEKFEARFGEEYVDAVEFKKQAADDTMDSGLGGDRDQADSIQKTEVWEIWSKEDKKVYWYGKGADKCLDMKDDPLKLLGFFPCPKPLLANVTTTLLVPKADYTFAQDLYNEIDVLQTRIATITRAIKVVGVYDKSAGDSVGRMLKEGSENDLIPVDNWAMFAEKGAIKGVIDWFPVETVVNTLDVLSKIQATKVEQLYEVTGMSDIMRGANTEQYTGVQTQQMKAKMGSISIQAQQDEFARFASDLESLKAEVIATHFDQQSIVKQSSAQFLPMADKEHVPAALELIKSPDVRWRINIKPESLSMVDYAQLKAERTDFLMSMAQFVQSASSAVAAIPESLPLLMEMMKWAMAGFKGSEYLEGTMDKAIQMAAQMPPPGQEEKGPSPEQLRLETEKIKAQVAQQKGQADLQKIQTKAQADMALAQTKLQGEIQKITVDAQRDMTIEQTQAQNGLIEIARELEAQIAEIQAAMASSLTIERAQAEFDIAAQDNAHENTMREIAAQNRGRSNAL